MKYHKIETCLLQISNLDPLHDSLRFSPVVRSLLKQCFATQVVGVMLKVVGFYLHLVWHIGGWLTFFATVGLSIWVGNTPISQEKKRLSLAMIAKIFDSASVACLFEWACGEPSKNVAVCVALASLFACMLGAIMFPRHRMYFYLCGLLSSGVPMFLWSHYGYSVLGLSPVRPFLRSYSAVIVVGVPYVILKTSYIISKPEANLAALKQDPIDFLKF